MYVQFNYLIKHREYCMSVCNYFQDIRLFSLIIAYYNVQTPFILTRDCSRLRSKNLGSASAYKLVENLNWPHSRCLQPTSGIQWSGKLLRRPEVGRRPPSTRCHGNASRELVKRMMNSPQCSTVTASFCITR